VGEAPVTPVSTLDSSYLTFPTNRAVFFPCLEGFPKIFIVFLCMEFLLVILVIAGIVNGEAAFVYGSSKC
jgi:hypothetical protein